MESTPTQTASTVRLSAPPADAPAFRLPRQAPPAPAAVRPTGQPPAAASLPAAPRASLIVIATGNETLAALYRKVYRGLTPPPYTAVAAVNPQQPKRGDVLTFPPPADGWHTDRTSPVRQ